MLRNLTEKYQVWFLTQVAAFIMGLMLVVDSQNWKVLTSYSGYFSVGFLVATLSLNPLKKLFPRWMMITKLNRYRRELGVAVFSFATIHMICFIIKRGSIMKTLPYALHSAIGPVLLVAYPIFFLLAISSNQYSIKKLTFLKWKKLHKTVYIAEGAVIIHMILVGQKLWAALLFTPLVVLQFIRIRKNKQKEPYLMKLTNLSIKLIFFSVVMIVCTGIGQGVDDFSEETKLFLAHGKNTINHTVRKGSLREHISTYSASFDLKKTREQHAQLFQKVEGYIPNLGLLAIINLSSSDLNILHYKVKAKDLFITARVYGARCNFEKISLLKENTVFINLHTCQDERGEDLYYIRSDIFSSYFPIYCNVIAFGEYDRHDNQLVVEGILNRYAHYSKVSEQHRLEERIRNEPELCFYLQDSEKFSASFRKKNLIIFYESKILDLS